MEAWVHSLALIHQSEAIDLLHTLARRVAQLEGADCHFEELHLGLLSLRLTPSSRCASSIGTRVDVGLLW